MLKIPERLFFSDTVHRDVTSDPFNGIVSCGFLHKSSKQLRLFSDIDLTFDYYGGLLVLSGSGTHIDNEGKSWPVTQGSFIQRIPGKLHSTYIKPDGLWLEFYICIGKDLFDSLVKLRMLDGHHDVLAPGITIGLLRRMEYFLQSCKKAEETDLPFLLVEAQHLLVTIFQMHCQATNNDSVSDWIDKACRLIGELAASNKRHVLVEDIAKELGVGVELFRKKFKSRIGISPGEYFRRRRINIAQSMLANRHRSVKEVALDLGFSDGFAFSKQFKKLVGISPSQFRKLY